MREGIKEELHKAIMATVGPEIDKLIAERDAALARVKKLTHLLALAEDDISDAHTLGLVRAELGAEPAQDICHWGRVEDNDDDLWSTSCGGEWYFTEGDPSEGGYTFCPKCGKRIEFERRTEEARS